MKEKTRRDIIWFLIIFTMVIIGIILAYIFISSVDAEDWVGNISSRLYD